MALPESCATFFSSCANKFKEMSFNQFWKMLIGTDTNGCPAVRITGDINAVSTPAIPVQRTLPVSTIETNDGFVIPGSKWVEFITSDDFDGTINGTSYPSGFSKFYPPLPNGDTYPAINYEIVTGDIRIERLT